MHLCCWPFWWPQWCATAIQTALLDAACPGPPWKPLDATIRQLLAPYCPSGRQGNCKQKDDKKWINFAGHVNGRVVRQYNTAHISQWRRSRALVEATGRHHRASIAANSCNWSGIHHFFEIFHHKLIGKGCRYAKAPVFNGGLTYQSKERGLTKAGI